MADRQAVRPTERSELAVERRRWWREDIELAKSQLIEARTRLRRAIERGGYRPNY
ncbi:MAG: hypothetical protein HYU51_01270 [Candidatus Rokubacteria bacterium]|nr:hypothetical protein [Candidatus Rokubacteria bacterium]